MVEDSNVSLTASKQDVHSNGSAESEEFVQWQECPKHHLLYTIPDLVNVLYGFLYAGEATMIHCHNLPYLAFSIFNSNGITEKVYKPYDLDKQLVSINEHKEGNLKKGQVRTCIPPGQKTPNVHKVFASDENVSFMSFELLSSTSWTLVENYNAKSQSKELDELYKTNGFSLLSTDDEVQVQDLYEGLELHALYSTAMVNLPQNTSIVIQNDPVIQSTSHKRKLIARIICKLSQPIKGNIEIVHNLECVNERHTSVRIDENNTLETILLSFPETSTPSDPMISEKKTNPQNETNTQFTTELRNISGNSDSTWTGRVCDIYC